MLLSVDKSQLLIVDMQERLVPVMDKPGTVIAGCRTLAKGAAILGVPTIVSQQYPAGIGPTIEGIRKELPDRATILDKMTFSCVREEKFSQHMDSAATVGRKQWVLAGIEAHVCVLQTAIDLKESGYDVVVVADAISSRLQQSKEQALQRMAQAGVIIATTEMVLFEWLEQAGTANFKAVSKLIK